MKSTRNIASEKIAQELLRKHLLSIATRDAVGQQRSFEQLISLGSGAVLPLGREVANAQNPSWWRESCAESLEYISPDGVSYLLDRLRDTEGELAMYFAWGCRWNRHRDVLEPALFDLLTHARVGVRQNAALALRYIHTDLSTCDERLLNAILDDDVRVSELALETLRELANVALSEYDLEDEVVLGVLVEMSSPLSETQLIVRDDLLARMGVVWTE